MRHRFISDQWVPYPREFVFAFFADPRNLPPLMPRWQKTRIDHMRIVPPPAPRTASEQSVRSSAPLAGNGSVILISFRPFPLSPVRLSWRAVISTFIMDHNFCDEQQRGPFAFWKHCHHVQDESHSGVDGTLITDEVIYEMKMSAAGELARRLFFARQMESLFRYRQERLPGLLEAARGKARSDERWRRAVLSRNQPGVRSAL